MPTTFAARVSALRRDRHLTLDALASAANLNPQTLGRLERGLPPTLDHVARLSRTLALPAADLAGLAVADRLRALAAAEGQ